MSRKLKRSPRTCIDKESQSSSETIERNVKTEKDAKSRNLWQINSKLFLSKADFDSQEKSMRNYINQLIDGNSQKDSQLLRSSLNSSSSSVISSFEESFGAKEILEQPKATESKYIEGFVKEKHFASTSDLIENLENPQDAYILRNPERSIQQCDNVVDSFTDSENESATEETNNLFVIPNKWLLYFSFIIFVAIISSLIFDSLRILITYSVHNQTRTLLWLYSLGSVTDIFNLLDLTLLLYLTLSNRSTASRKVSTKNNIFATNMLISIGSAIPFSLINCIFALSGFKSNGFVYQETALSYGVCFRLFKLPSNAFFAKLVFHKNLETNKVFKFIFVLMLTMHCLTSFFFFLVIQTGDQDHWLLKELANGLFSAYCASLYFHYVTLLSVGYGDLVPVRIGDKIYICLLLIVGVLLFAFALSSLARIFNEESNGSEDKMNKLQELCMQYKVPTRLKTRLVQSIKVGMKRKSKDNFYAFIETLTHSLKSELVSQIQNNELHQLSVLKGKPVNFVLFFLKKLKTVNVFKNDSMLGAGDFLDEMYIVKKGKLRVSLGESMLNCKIGTIAQNVCFGDVYIFYNQQSSFHIKCESRTATIHMLNREHYAELAIKFKEEVNEMLLESLQRLEYFESIRLVLQEVARFSCEEKDLELAKRMFKSGFIENAYKTVDIGVCDDDIVVIEEKNRAQNERLLNTIIKQIYEETNNWNELPSKVPYLRQAFVPTLNYDKTTIGKMAREIRSNKKSLSFLKSKMLSETQIDRNVVKYLKTSQTTIEEYVKRMSQSSKPSVKSKNKLSSTVAYSYSDKLCEGNFPSTVVSRVNWKEVRELLRGLRKMQNCLLSCKYNF